MLNSNVLESQRTPISDECRLRFDDYLVSIFPSRDDRIISRPEDDIYAELYSIRYSIAERKVKEFYK